MVKASPMVRSFNGGEFSALMEGRTDIDRYPSSMRRLLNYVAAPQGPAIGRSGTAFVAPVSRHDEESVLIPFVFSDEQSLQLEFASDRIRFVSENGLQVYPALAVTTVASQSPFVVTAATLAADVGDDVVLSGYPVDYNLNGEVVRITAKAGDDYTLETTWPLGKAPVAGGASRVYHVLHSYTLAQRRRMRPVQTADVTYLLTGSRTRKLSRYGAYDWRLEDVKFIDGPYLPINKTPTTLTVGGTGNAIPNMTANDLPSPFVASASSTRPAMGATPPSNYQWLGRDPVWVHYTVAAEPWRAFTADDPSIEGGDYNYWAGSVMQRGVLSCDFGSVIKIDGYTLYMARDNRDADYSAKDYAPSSWTFEVSTNGSSWTTVHSQEEYVAYDNAKSVFFKLDVPADCRYCRIAIRKLYRNGSIEARVRRLIVRGVEASKNIVVNASSVVGINRDQGFVATDVGRLLRMKDVDNSWRSLRITEVVTPTQVKATLEGEPFFDVKPTTQWRLGYWSDTTGWPTTGDFFEDRLSLAGNVEYPDMFAMSVIGSYETFSQTTADGVVTDDSAVVGRINARKLSAVRWIASDEKGLIFGTGSGEYLLSTAKGELEAVTARNVKARSSTNRGSADVEPVKVDRQVLYVQRAGRTLREMAFVYEADGYKSPSMSQLASHIGISKFVEIEYAAEPYSIIWVRREDGSVVGLTYNRDENVIGWHRHDFSGAIVESMSVIPQADQTQDSLWIVARRTINGQTRRYIERLTRFWDFDMDIDDAMYVDSGVRINIVTPTTEVYGLSHLEGEQAYGLADGQPFGPIVVVGGRVSLPREVTSYVVVGLGFDADGETSRLDNGAQDGTAIGKNGRIHNLSLLVWASYGGQLGTWNEQAINEIDGSAGTVVYDDVEYERRADVIEQPRLYTGETKLLTPQPGYEKKNTVSFRRRKEEPLPFNIVAIMPQMDKQDR